MGPATPISFLLAVEWVLNGTARQPAPIVSRAWYNSGVNLFMRTPPRCQTLPLLGCLVAVLSGNHRVSLTPTQTPFGYEEIRRHPCRHLYGPPCPRDQLPACSSPASCCNWNAASREDDDATVELPPDRQWSKLHHPTDATRIKSRF